MKSFWTFVACLMLTSAIAYAQPAPPPDGGDRGGPGPGQQDGPGRRGRPGEQGMGGMPGMPGQGRPDGMGPGGPGGGGPGGGPMREVEMMRAYLEVVDRYAKVSSDPATSGIAAVVAARDTLKQRGADAAIEYFTKILPEVKNESVARCIRAQLADLYKQSGQQDKALDQLHSLIVDTPNEKR